MRAKKWLKEYGPSILVTAAIAALVYLSQFPYLAGIISFVAVDGVVGYWYKNKIIGNRTKLKLQSSSTSTETFNLEYYDLYYEFSYNQWTVILKAACLAFSLCPIIHDFIGEEISYIPIGMGLAGISVSIAAIASSSGKRSKVFVKLLSKRRDNWFGEFTPEELSILNELKGI